MSKVTPFFKTSLLATWISADMSDMPFCHSFRLQNQQGAVAHDPNLRSTSRSKDMGGNCSVLHAAKMAQGFCRQAKIAGQGIHAIW